jgi:hypothetical protein
MNELREAPAFLEFPSDHLSSYSFRNMPPDVKGVWIMLRYTLWIEDNILSDKNSLCAILGIDINSLEKAWPYIIPKYFDYVPGDKSLLFCPSLTIYKETYKEDRKRKSEGGKKGYAIKQAARQTISGAEKKYSSEDIVDFG